MKINKKQRNKQYILQWITRTNMNEVNRANAIQGLKRYDVLYFQSYRQPFSIDLHSFLYKRSPTFSRNWHCLSRIKSFSPSFLFKDNDFFYLIFSKMIFFYFYIWYKLRKRNRCFCSIFKYQCDSFLTRFCF